MEYKFGDKAKLTDKQRAVVKDLFNQVFLLEKAVETMMIQSMRKKQEAWNALVEQGIINEEVWQYRPDTSDLVYICRDRKENNG